jgi:hypothetical protein
MTLPLKKKTAAALLEQPLSLKEKLKSTSCIPYSLGAEWEKS